MKQDVFHPLKNFFRSGFLIVFAPVRFFREFGFLQGSWQRALGFGLGYKVLTALAYGLVVQLFFLTPLMQAFRGIQFPSDQDLKFQEWELLFRWMHLPSEVSLVAIPLLHIPETLFGAVVMWGVMALARCQVRFKTAFNLINLFAPYELFCSLVVGIGVLFLNSLQTLFIMGGIVGILLLLSLILMTRTFHYSVKEAIQETLQQDARALWRFYVVLTVIFLLPCVAILLGAWFLRWVWVA